MNQSANDILLIIVNYNQMKEIEHFLTSLAPYWPKEHSVFIDDGSSDGSLAVAQHLGYSCIVHPQNRGVGAAIRSGLLRAKEKGYESVLIMSSNGKMLPEQINEVVVPVYRKEVDYVTGSRFICGGNSPGLSFFRRASIPAFSLLSTVLLGRKFTDITCGFRCYRIDFLFNGNCDISQEWLSRYELEYYIHFWACSLGLKIQEVPVTIKYNHLEKKRTSKIRPIIDWWSMLRPLLFLRLGIKK